MTIYDMSTTNRHIDILNEFTVQSGIMRKIKNITLKTYQEEASLVHYGNKRKDPYMLSLIDLDEPVDIDLINHLERIQPDFILFKENTYQWNQKGTRLAGCPDLVVEVWSDSNTQIDKELKFLIYSNSNGKTEHWYIEQDSNEVKCYLGEKQLESQSLTNVLKTQAGFEFDLRSVAL